MEQRKINVYIDPCFCGSGRTIAACCFAEIDTSPPGQPTGFGHLNCYARALGDCSPIISREHYISENVLRLFDGNVAETSSPPWSRDGARKTIGINSLTGKILCDRHNSALSRLDELVGKFFRLVIGKAEGQQFSVIRGYELERWLLKAYCGLVKVGAIKPTGLFGPDGNPSGEALKILFCRNEIPPGCGFAHAIRGKNIPFQKGQFLWAGHNQDLFGVSGFYLQLDYFPMYFAFEPVNGIPDPSKHKYLLRHHPNSIQILRRGEHWAELHFGWPDGPDTEIEIHD
jgi:hypothetical protein